MWGAGARYRMALGWVKEVRPTSFGDCKFRYFEGIIFMEE